MAKIRLGLLVVITILALLPNGNIMAADANKPAEPNLAAMKPDTVMAKYGDQTLTLGEVKYIIPAPTPESARQLAQQWIDLETMYDAAKQRGITDDPKTKFLADLGTKSLFSRELMNKVAAEVNVPDTNILAYYEKNKHTDPQLFEPNRVSFTHVRTKTIEEANAVKKRIEAGEDIETIAKEVSIAPDAKNGGEAKRVPESLVQQQYGKEFVDVFLAASEGKIIGPLKTKDGYEVLRHEGRLTGKVHPFEKVKDTIKRREEQVAQSHATQKYLDDLKKSSQSKTYLSPLLETSRPMAVEGKSGAEQNLPVDKSKIKSDNVMQKK